VNQIKKIKKIRINRTIFFVLSAMIFTFSCSDQPLNNEELSSSCANTKKNFGHYLTYQIWKDSFIFSIRETSILYWWFKSCKL